MVSSIGCGMVGPPQVGREPGGADGATRGNSGGSGAGVDVAGGERRDGATLAAVVDVDLAAAALVLGAHLVAGHDGVAGDRGGGALEVGHGGLVRQRDPAGGRGAGAGGLGVRAAVGRPATGARRVVGGRVGVAVVGVVLLDRAHGTADVGLRRLVGHTLAVVEVDRHGDGDQYADDDHDDQQLDEG